MDINLPLSPPVNNNIQISLHDRLDAVVFEKIRVANTQLDTRLTLQEKIINKYRKDAEKTHAHQAQVLKREVKKIRQKKPDYVFDDSDVSSSRSRQMTEGSRQRCLSEPSNLCYCRRYYAHHFNVRDTTRDEKKQNNSKKAEPVDFFNLKLRLYFLNVMNKEYENTKLRHSDGDEYLQHVKEHGFEPFGSSKPLQDSKLQDSFDRSRNSRFFSQTSLDYESDDVFESSHDSFKGLRVKREQAEREKPTELLSSLQESDTELQEIKEATEGQTNNLYEQDNVTVDCSGKKNGQTDANESNICEQSLDNHLPKLNVSLTDVRRNQRRKGNRKVKRRSFIGSGSEAEKEYNESERRKSKHAFEKIFAGLL